MANKSDSKKSKKAESETTPKGIGVGGNVDKSTLIYGSNNIVNNYYYETVATNIEKREPDFWNLKHPYPMPPNFTGRIAERAILTQWLNENSENRLFILRALGGFGKSALTWHWLTHDVDPKVWKKVIFWSFYEGDAGFENFIIETLTYLNLKVPKGKRTQVDELLKVLQKEKVLLIMDGFERLLRAYNNMNASHQSDAENHEDKDRDCVDLNVEHFLKSICSIPTLKSKVLMTTRISPHVLEKFGQFIQGCVEIELKEMQKEDAIVFFRVQGVLKGTNQEIADVCKLYGYHPLSLRLLVGHIIANFKNSGDIAVAQNLKVSGSIAKHQNHILNISYTSLLSNQQKLLSTIACFRASTKLDTLESIIEHKETLETDLHDLIERGLLQYDTDNKIFDLHPIVRRYAYYRLTNKDRTGAHERLVNYFALIPQPEKVKKIEDLAPLIELYHHMVSVGTLDEAANLFISKLSSPLLDQFGAYQICAELLTALFPEGENKLPKLEEKFYHAPIVDKLAMTRTLSGQPRHGITLFEMKNKIREDEGHIENLVIGLDNLAYLQISIGALRNAESNLYRGSELYEKLFDVDSDELESHKRGIGYLYAVFGKWDIAWQELEACKNYKEYGTLTSILMSRENKQSILLENHTPVNLAKKALKSAQRKQQIRYIIRAQRLLGLSYYVEGQLDFADRHLTEALVGDRSINMIDVEADILVDLAKLRYAQKKYQEAKSLADEALTITERCGYVLQGADVNLFLSQYALEQERDKVKAKEYAETALKLAYCDGPPYYYKVAYHEAEAMLERISKDK